MTRATLAAPFREPLDDALVTRHERHGDFINRLFQDEALGAFFRGWMLDEVYGGCERSARPDHRASGAVSIALRFAGPSVTVCPSRTNRSAGTRRLL